MKPHSYTDEGIILSRINYGESDRILTIFSKSYGRITLMAKGIRKPKSKKRGHVEIFSLLNFQAINGHGMDLMIEADILEDFNNIRKSLGKVTLAYYFMEVISKITHEGEPNTELFDLLLDFLNQLNITKKLKKLRLNFIFKLLLLMGYWPDNMVMDNADMVLEEVIERKISSMRVGKRILES